MFELALEIYLKNRFQVPSAKKVTFALLFRDKMLPLAETAETEKLSFFLLVNTILTHYMAILHKEIPGLGPIFILETADLNQMWNRQKEWTNVIQTTQNKRNKLTLWVFAALKLQTCWILIKRKSITKMGDWLLLTAKKLFRAHWEKISAARKIYFWCWQEERKGITPSLP